MNRLVIYIFLCLTPLGVKGQEQPVDVAELTLKVGLGGKEELYYSFAAGDQIVFNFEEVKGKVLKEIEITEYQRMITTPEYVALNKVRMNARSSKVRVTAGLVIKI